ncbi:MAG: hypothetical protein HQL30_09640 [Candidatus Omnitrophica bacterium]|nr:hypothetical protein [Candidatus Omnitrophota bacterium]
MSDNKKTVKIFTLEQQFPCGPNASCCGPAGQSEQEIAALRGAIEKLGFDVEVFDIKKMKGSGENPQVAKLFAAFGAQATPIITVGDDVASMGQAEVGSVISAVKTKLY